MTKRKVLAKERNRRKSKQSPKRFRPLKLRTHLKKSVGSCAKNRAHEKAEKPCFLLRKIRENDRLIFVRKKPKNNRREKVKNRCDEEEFREVFRAVLFAHEIACDFRFTEASGLQSSGFPFSALFVFSLVSLLFDDFPHRHCSFSPVISMMGP